MDMGLNNLFAVVTTDGSVMLIKGETNQIRVLLVEKRNCYIPVYKGSA